MNELGWIEEFVAVATRLNFSRAAESLGIPASTLTRRISELETAIGTKLLVRSTRRVSLTGAGRLYLPYCIEILESARRAKTALWDAEANPVGELKISIPPDFATTFMVPVIAQFRAQYPSIKLLLDLSPLRVNLVEGGFDLAIRIGDDLDDTLFVRRLVLAARGLFASPTLFRGGSFPQHPDQLRDYPRITAHPSDAEAGWRLTRDGQTVSVGQPDAICVNSPRMALALAQAGVGITAVDWAIACVAVQEESLVPVLSEWEMSPVAINVVTTSRMLPGSTRVFVDHLHDHLKRIAAPHHRF